VNDAEGGGNLGISAQGTLHNTGTIKVLSAGSQVFLQIPNGETLRLSGSGEVIMGDGTDNSNNNLPTIGSLLGTNGIFVNQSSIQGTGSIGLIQTITNQGTINANVPVGASGLLLMVGRNVGAVTNSGTFEASNGGELQATGFQSFDNPGTLTAAAKSTIDITNSGSFLNLVSGTLTGGTYKVAGTLQIPGDITTNDARITLTGPASQILNPNTNAPAGFVTNGSKGSFTLAGGQSFTSAGTFTNQGAITIARGGTFTVGAGGSYLQHGGRIAVDGKLTLSKTDDRTDNSNSDSDSNSEPSAVAIRIFKGSLFGNGGTVAAGVSSSGTVIPGNQTTAGKLTVTGAYTQSAAGALDANIAGANSGQFSVLNVKRTATLGGTLNINLLNKFVPLIGATFEILTAPHVNGTFATVNGTVINSDEHFQVTYNSNNVTLTVVAGN
jgi:hypothetical protein